MSDPVETKKPAETQEKPKYESPQLVQLDNVMIANGFPPHPVCQSGKGDVTMCSDGSSHFNKG